MAANAFKFISGSYNWDAANNWSLGAVPQANDDVTVNGLDGKSLFVSILSSDPAYTVASLTENTSSTSAAYEGLSVAGRLNVTGTANLSGAFLSVSGDGQVTLGNVAASGNVQVVVNGSRSSSLSVGSFSVDSGSTLLSLSNGSVSLGAVSGALTVSATSGTVTLASTSGSGSFNLYQSRLNLLSTSNAFTAALSAGNSTVQVDLAAFAYQSGETYSIAASTTGYFPSYKITLRSALGDTLYTFQNVGGIGPLGSQVAPTVALASDGAGGTLVTLGVPASVQAAPSARLFLPSGTGAYSIVDTATLPVVGNAPAGATVTVYANGSQQGAAVTTNASGVYSTSVATLPGLGSQTVDLMATAATSTATTSNDVSLPLFVLPAAVNGTTSPTLTSRDIDKLLGQGYNFQFIDGTSAVKLTNGTITFGDASPAALVQRLYVGLLGRSGDPAGLGVLTTELANGASLETVAGQILGGQEYAALHGSAGSQTDQQFATGLYGSFYHRAPDDAGLGTILRQLSSGVSRAQVAVEFAQSSEAKAVLASSTAEVWALDAPGALVTQMYEIGLGRAPDANGLALLKQQLAAGLSGITLAQEIVATPEFQSLHRGQDAAGLVNQLYANATGQGSGGADASLVESTRQFGAASTLYALAASGEATRYLSPDIRPILPAAG